MTISGNPNITIEFIQKNIDKNLDWYEISWNKFDKHWFLVAKEKKRKIKCWKKFIDILISE